MNDEPLTAPVPPCGFIPPTAGYAACTRTKGHSGPCAHPFDVTYPPTDRQIKAAAAAIANARGGRSGMPPISNVLDALPPSLVDEVMEDALLALVAAHDATKEPS